MNRLTEIADKTRQRIQERRRQRPMKLLCKEVEKAGPYTGPSFEKAMTGPELSFICEVKKASPSKGLIAREFAYMEIATAYEHSGASAISCLTEPFYFQGSDRYLQEIASQVHIPLLRKDFTVDPYMIYEARLLGASAVLLICAILTDQELKQYQELAQSLGMSALVEVHTRTEADRALESGAKIIGVNSRDLTTFEVRLETLEELGVMIPQDRLLIAESGIHSAAQLDYCKSCGADGVLIGEALMRTPAPGEALRKLRGEMKGE